MKIRIYISVLILGLSTIAFGQGLDPKFSLYGDQSAFMNPALIGNFDHKWELSTTYREQGRSISTPITTVASNFQMNLPINAWSGNIWGFGLSFLNDAQGDAATLTNAGKVSFSLGQYLDPRKEHSLSVGFDGGFGQRSIDYTDVYWDRQWRGEGFQIETNSGEPTPTGEPLNQNVRGFADMGTGIQYTYRGPGLIDARVGGAMLHFLRPEVGLYKDSASTTQHRTFAVHADMEYRFNKDSRFYVRPSAYYSRQGVTDYFILGNDFVFMFNEPTRTTGKRKEYSMTMGVFHRFGIDAIATMRLNLAGFTFGYAYDFTVNSQRVVNGYQGALEVFVGYKAGFQKGSNNGYNRYKTGKL